jgi:hypothetical protein
MSLVYHRSGHALRERHESCLGRTRARPPRAHPDTSKRRHLEGFHAREAPCPLSDGSCPASHMRQPTSSRAAKGSFWLRWTATGDDGNIGRAARYDIRYSQFPISGIDTSDGGTGRRSSTPPGRFPPLPVRRTRCSSVNVTYGTRYYAMMRVADEVPNWSRYSNLATFLVITGVESESSSARGAASGRTEPLLLENRDSVLDSRGRTHRSHRVRRGGPPRAASPSRDAERGPARDRLGRTRRGGKGRAIGIYFIRIRSGVTTISTKVFRTR